MLYDWSGINQLPDGNHKAFVPDGQLCGGGKPLYQGMNLPRTDWYTTSIAPDSQGNFQFLFNASAPHATRYHYLYVTNNNYDPTKPLTWSDLDPEPFCKLGNLPLENGHYKLNCPLPKDRSGKRIIYHIWQRSDSAEAFYSCVDVNIAGQPSPWKEIGQIRAAQNLTVGSVLTFRLFDPQGADIESHSLTLAAGQISAASWPYYLAQRVNAQSNSVRVGVLNGDGSITPVMSNSENRVYNDDGATYTFKVDIETPSPNPTPTISPSPKPSPTPTATPTPKPTPTLTPTPKPTTPPSTPCAAAWRSTTIYSNPGHRVKFAGHNFQNKWWTRGDQPDKSGQWGVWKDLGTCKK